MRVKVMMPDDPLAKEIQPSAAKARNRFEELRKAMQQRRVKMKPLVVPCRLSANPPGLATLQQLSPLVEAWRSDRQVQAFAAPAGRQLIPLRD